VGHHSPSPTQYAKKLQQHQEGHSTLPKKNLIYKDPYHFPNNQNRKVDGLRSKANDEWQAYWEQDEDPEEYFESKSTFAASGLAAKVKSR